MSDSSSQLAADAVMATQRETGPVVERVSANFHKSLWGDRFLSTDLPHSQGPGEGAVRSEYEALKEEVRKMVMSATTTTEGGGDVVQSKLRLIDAIQRLGVGYLFEMEIEEVLAKIHALGHDFIFHNDLYHSALCFRLLRQQGFPVSPDGFGKLKDSEGKLGAWDEAGVLSLYEAAHVAIRGEGILDEARVSATEKLESIIPKSLLPSSSSFHKQVKFALSLPVWKCEPRTLARNYIGFYSEVAEEKEKEDSIISHKLLKFAKLDFNMLQKLHQRELRQLTQWRKCLGVAVDFPYARDRLVECYFWLYSLYFDPKYHLARLIGSKVISMLSLLDDTYDGFGTYQEVQILTAAIERFDRSSLETLPDSMKAMYRVIIDLYEEIEMELAKIGSTFVLDYGKEELKKLCRSYLIEVQWRTEEHIPTYSEYMKVASVTGGTPVLCTSAFLGVGPELATTEAFEWVTNNPNLVRATGLVCRLKNDIASHKFERKRKHVATAVECYMKEQGVSEEDAIEFLHGEIREAWKEIVESCQKPAPLPVGLRDIVVNMGRCMNVIYEKGDGYTNSYLIKSQLASLFVDPIPLS